MRLLLVLLVPPLERAILFFRVALRVRLLSGKVVIRQEQWEVRAFTVLGQLALREVLRQVTLVLGMVRVVRVASARTRRRRRLAVLVLTAL
jgi:hypothetical protein